MLLVLLVVAALAQIALESFERQVEAPHDVAGQLLRQDADLLHGQQPGDLAQIALALREDVGVDDGAFFLDGLDLLAYVAAHGRDLVLERHDARAVEVALHASGAARLGVDRLQLFQERLSRSAVGAQLLLQAEQQLVLAQVAVAPLLTLELVLGLLQRLLRAVLRLLRLVGVSPAHAALRVAHGRLRVLHALRGAALVLLA